MLDTGGRLIRAAATAQAAPTAKSRRETSRVDHDQLERVAELLARRNEIDRDIADVIKRPMTAGHLGEWVAAQIFDIQLEDSAVATAIDGIFRSGQLAGRTVNVK